MYFTLTRMDSYFPALAALCMGVRLSLERKSMWQPPLTSVMIIMRDFFSAEHATVSGVSAKEATNNYYLGRYTIQPHPAHKTRSRRREAHARDSSVFITYYNNLEKIQLSYSSHTFTQQKQVSFVRWRVDTAWELFMKLFCHPFQRGLGISSGI